MSVAVAEAVYKEAARLFETIGECQDSAALAQTCYEKAEMARKDTILSMGKVKMNGQIISNYEDAIKIFESISGWKNGAYVNSSNGNCWWWLRSPGYDQICAASVDYDGFVYECGGGVGYGDRAVRPALWIDLSKVQ